MLGMAAFLGFLLGTMLDPPLIILAVIVAVATKSLATYLRFILIIVAAAAAGGILRAIMPHDFAVSSEDIARTALFDAIGGCIWLGIFLAGAKIWRPKTS